MTHPFHFVVYYNDTEYEPRKNTRNDDVSTQKFRSRTHCRCRSEILTFLLFHAIILVYDNLSHLPLELPTRHISN